MNTRQAIARSDEPTDESRSLDRTAFTALFRDSHDGVYRYVRARCKTDDEAADLAATVFERAWRSRDRFRGSVSGSTAWLFQIARRLTIDAARRRGTARRGLIFWPPPEVAPDPADLVLRDEQDRLLAERLALLPELEREAILLRFAAGPTAREIGGVIGKREEATQKLISRALARLKEDYRDGE